MDIINTFLIHDYRCFPSPVPEIEGVNVSQVGWKTECGEVIRFGSNGDPYTNNSCLQNLCKCGIVVPDAYEPNSCSPTRYANVTTETYDGTAGNQSLNLYSTRTASWTRNLIIGDNDVEEVCTRQGDQNVNFCYALGENVVDYWQENGPDYPIGGYKNTFTNPITEPFIFPNELPSYPSFNSQNLSNKDVFKYPNNYLGNYGQNIGATFKNFNQNSISQTEFQKCQYRIKHFPTARGYLKVWVRKKYNQYVWENCQWVLDQEDLTQNLTPYVWNYSNQEVLILNPGVEDTIFSLPYEVVPGAGQVGHVEIYKYSFVENYEPEDPLQDGSQPNSPNGWPRICV